jgi:hypothetical protein
LKDHNFWRSISKKNFPLIDIDEVITFTPFAQNSLENLMKYIRLEKAYNSSTDFTKKYNRTDRYLETIKDFDIFKMSQIDTIRLFEDFIDQSIRFFSISTKKDPNGINEYHLSFLTLFGTLRYELPSHIKLSEKYIMTLLTHSYF